MSRLHQIHLWLFALLLGLRSRPNRDERGDVPGWVLVTVMSVGLVTAIGLIAKPELEQMLRAAFNRVK